MTATVTGSGTATRAPRATEHGSGPAETLAQADIAALTMAIGSARGLSRRLAEYR